jgi:uracil-DNA glycosylase
MSEITPRIENSWKEALWDAFQLPSFVSLKTFLLEERTNHNVYPPGPQIFNAFNRTPLHKVKVVILGQDPYHGPGQAHGLCFSVPYGVKPPPSLVNIFKELQKDLGIKIPDHGNLESWTDQGVMLLNATLTVRANSAGSHQKRGWEEFTDYVIRTISEKRDHVVFLLWGRYAQAKEALVDGSRHLILKSAHPSPLSAHNGFFGCKHFSKTNNYLKECGLDEIDWQIT